ncbi:MAG: histone deacetylase [Planctomycetota bacterium]
MGIGYLTDQRMMNHRPGPGHPERPERLRAIHDHLRTTGLIDRLTRIAFGPAQTSDLLRVHDRAYLDRLSEACRQGATQIDCEDSKICRDSEQAARLAVGAGLAAVDAVVAGRAIRAFCTVRPPGHHAEHGRSMGFCLYNNIAIAAEHALAEHGLSRVAVVDIYAHHGNGTQHRFELRGDVLFISIHEHPDVQYPGTGYESETGQGAGEGMTLNVPLMPGADDEKYHQAMTERVVPALDRFAPELLLVSAGFDAAAADPLGHMAVSAAGFGQMGRQLVSVADRHCEGRLVGMLEGGYDLTALAQGVAAYLEALG